MRREYPILLCVLLCMATVVGAADKNGVSPGSISLPKGPGSIEGLGESFQPSLNTGTAKYGIGFKLAPGVAGHAPSLSLSYEGGRRQWTGGVRMDSAHGLHPAAQ
jgi:hypothetical protein